MTRRVAIINILSFDHPHAESLFSEGLWGLPEDKLGSNRRKWEELEKGDRVLLYGGFKGVKGIWLLCNLVEKTIDRSPIKYWHLNPTGFPLHIRVRPILPIERFERRLLESVDPVMKDELVSIGIKMFRQKLDRWSIMVFSDKDQEEYARAERIINILQERNEKLRPAVPDHDLIKKIIYKIGEMQNRFPDKEYPIENRRIDVVWRRTPKSMPSVAFEVQIGGSIFEALSKLKHAFDLWNTIPVLITTDDQINEANRWIEGSFHELKHVFRVISWKDISEFYEIKQKAKDFEKRLGII